MLLTPRNALLTAILLLAVSGPVPAADPPPEAVRPWLGPQAWERDVAGPVLSLGEAGDFDDTHLFAPCVGRFGDTYHLWYSGSTGSVAERVFDLGLATSPDGRRFTKHPGNPIYRFGDGKHSVLTAALLRSENGKVLKEDGRLRLWFSSTHFAGGTGLHTLHETTSENGVDWSAPSPPQLQHVYAPTILKDGNTYRLWYTDVSSVPWLFRAATSPDGRTWTVHPEPILQVDQTWERDRLFYPIVVKTDGVFLMWYGSYWSAHRNKTAIGFAVSTNGLTWHKHPHNPVLTPDPNRPWESHYTTSGSVVRQPDGSFRIWYASRKEPPFVNKYFAIGTARWSGPTTAADGKP